MDLLETITLEKNNGKKSPIYKQVYQTIKEKIRQGDIQHGQILPKKADWARTLDLDFRTVRSAWEILQEEGLITVDEKGIARAEYQNSKKQNLQITLLRWEDTAFEIELNDGAKEYAKENNISIITLSLKQSVQLLDESLNSPIHGGGGFLIAPWDFPEFRKTIEDALEKGVTIIFEDRDLEGTQASSVAADHFMGGYKATQHLIEAHNMPVYFIGSQCPLSCRARYNGWAEAMAHYGFESNDKYTYYYDISEANYATLPHYSSLSTDSYSRAAMSLLTDIQGSKCCVFTSTDTIARGVYRAAEKLGQTIGKDIFLASYGNHPFCKNLPVPLTSVNQNNKKVGYAAAAVLEKLLRTDSSESIHQIVPVELIVRESSTGQI